MSGVTGEYQLPDMGVTEKRITAERETELRDRFAMAALTGILARGDIEDESTIIEICADSFRYADAMMRARKPARRNPCNRFYCAEGMEDPRHKGRPEAVRTQDIPVGERCREGRIRRRGLDGEQVMNYKNAIETELEPGQSVIARLDQTGDTKVFWNRGNQTETAIAKAAFTQAKADGFMAYKVTGADGMKGEVMAEFDPAAERIILAPPLRGG